jgi:hypothetical protein
VGIILIYREEVIPLAKKVVKKAAKKLDKKQAGKKK